MQGEVDMLWGVVSEEQFLRTGLTGEGARRSTRGARNPKKQGEAVEASFLQKAVSLGLQVAKPWGDSGRYDFVVDGGEKLYRVQVKSTMHFSEDRYRITARGCRVGSRYTAKEVDVIVAYVLPEDAWYVIPVQELRGQLSFTLRPGRERRVWRLEQYRDAWWVVGVQLPVTGHGFSPTETPGAQRFQSR